MILITSYSVPFVLYDSIRASEVRAMPRNKKKSPTPCALCKLPIKPVDRPSVRLDRGKEAHMECYIKATEGKREPIQ